MHFCYTAAQIEQLTNGHVWLKTLQNWATKEEWFSPIEPTSKGKPRRYSRMNVIEAVLASELMRLSVTRSTLNAMLVAQAVRIVSPIHSGQREVGIATAELRPKNLVDAADHIPALQPGSSGHYWLFMVGDTGAFNTMSEVMEPTLSEALKEQSGAVVVVPISKIVARVDQLIPQEDPVPARRRGRRTPIIEWKGE